MSDRVSSVQVERGLHVLRYVRSAAPDGPPAVTVRVAERSRGAIELVSAPDEENGVLVGPGSCLVVRAVRPGTLDVAVRANRAGQDDAELRLDRLAGGGERVVDAPASLATLPGRDATGFGSAELELTGHVARRGDVRAAAGGWVAGPEAPAPIEGMVARLTAAGGELGLDYQVLVGGREPRWTGWTAQGDFAGSRGQHQPLLAVRLRLTGRGASAYALKGEALFLGAPVRTSSGAEIDLTSDSGLDPLVGLKIALIPMRTAREQTDTVQTERISSDRDTGTGRVRVFRASGKR